MASSYSAGSLHHERTQDIVVISCIHANLETAITGRNKAKKGVFTGNHKLILCIVREQNSVEKKMP